MDRPSPVLTRDLAWYRTQHRLATDLAATYRGRRQRGDARLAAEQEHQAALWAGLAAELEAYLEDDDEPALW